MERKRRCAGSYCKRRLEDIVIPALFDAQCKMACRNLCGFFNVRQSRKTGAGTNDMIRLRGQLLVVGEWEPSQTLLCSEDGNVEGRKKRMKDLLEIVVELSHILGPV
jgi:hypothetical protein